MKRRLILTVAGVLITFFSMGQSRKEVSDKIVEKVMNYYNSDNYTELYNLLSDDYKKKWSASQNMSFYKNNVKASYGNIKAFNYVWDKSEELKYAVNLENGNLDLFFKISADHKITTQTWLPSVNKIIKRDINEIKSTNPKITSLQKSIDSLALKYLENDATCGLSIGLIKNNTVEQYYYGETKKGNNLIPDKNTIYEIGSITKTFTGIALANAVNKGMIKLDDDIRTYLGALYKNLEYKGSPIKIKHLSNHTSRLPGMPLDYNQQPNFNPLDPFKNYSRKMVLNYLSTIELDTIPGAKYEYSNLAVALLGMILENVYKKPLEDIYKSVIATPLKMKSTKLNLTEQEKAHSAAGYSQNGRETPNWNMKDMAAAGGLKSNLHDMFIYLQANMKKENSNILLSHISTFKDNILSIGLNWIIQPTKENCIKIWHNGGTGGFSSYCGFIKEKNVGVVVLSNSTAVRVDDIANGILKKLLID